MKKVLLTLVVILLYIPNAFSEIAVIVHPSNSSNVSDEDIKNIYLGKRKQFAEGGSVVPLSLESGSETNGQFCEKVLGRSESQFKAFWSKLMFTGKGSPPKEVTPSEMVDLVSRNPDMIGFVSSADVNDTVKVVATY